MRLFLGTEVRVVSVGFPQKEPVWTSRPVVAQSGAILRKAPIVRKLKVCNMIVTPKQPDTVVMNERTPAFVGQPLSNMIKYLFNSVRAGRPGGMLLSSLLGFLVTASPSPAGPRLGSTSSWPIRVPAVKPPLASQPTTP